jgi:hypothetical protein
MVSPPSLLQSCITHSIDMTGRPRGHPRKNRNPRGRHTSQLCPVAAVASESPSPKPESDPLTEDKPAIPYLCSLSQEESTIAAFRLQPHKKPHM